MSNRDTRVWAYLSDEEDRRLEEWADKAGKSKSHLVRDAILEYLDRDRSARVEDRIDDIDDKLDTVLRHLNEEGTHTHTDVSHTQPTTVTQKADRIEELVHGKIDGDVFKVDDLDAVIKEVAGGDDRTLRKYRDELRDRGVVYEHPQTESPVWTTDPEHFAQWVESHVNNVPDTHVRDLLEPYGMTIEEYERRLPAEAVL